MSVNVKLETDQKVEKAKMDTGGGSEAEKKREYLINANKRLRLNIAQFKERQEKLLEYLENEHSKGTIQRVSNNRAMLKFALCVTEEDLIIVDGKRTAIHEHMIKLNKLGNAFWKQQRSQIPRPIDSESKLRFKNSIPPEFTALKLSINFDSGQFTLLPVQRCQKCYSLSHELEYCPYKDFEYYTPQVIVTIEPRVRVEMPKKEEVSDPLLSKKYKRKSY